MENTEEVGHHEHGGENDQKEDEVESTRAKIGEAREENERLKTALSQIVKDYKSLQMHLFDIVQQEQSKKSFENSPKLPIDHHHAQEPHELVSLSLGTCSTEIIKGEEKGSKLEADDRLRSDGLTLGLERKNIESSNLITGTSSFEEATEEDLEAAVEAWPPSKMIRDLRGEDDEVATSQSNIGKRARVSVRARCDGPTMNDGCQWRKYGQKVSKGNPCPRAYYRCTVAPGCPVRKQVQRCIDDMSILITTYEGTHNHPLPVTATAMASTTSAAAHMLTSGPTAPRPATGSTSLASTSGPNGSLYISNPYPFPSTSHPTITLDLTSNSSLSSTSTTSQYLYPADSSHLNFRQSNVSSGLSYNYPPPQQRSSLSTDTIARAITSDPSFQSALVAAITSYVGASEAAQGSAFGSMRREGSGGSPVTMFGTAAGLSGTKSASASGSPVDEM